MYFESHFNGTNFRPTVAPHSLRGQSIILSRLISRALCRIWWTEPDRWTWGSDTLTYEVTRGSITQTRTGYNYLVVEELLTEGQALQYGVMRLCNAAGCSAPHDIVVTVPFRPNKPRVQLLGVSLFSLQLCVGVILMNLGQYLPTQLLFGFYYTA